MSEKILPIIIVLLQQSFGVYCFDYKHVNQWESEFSQCGGSRQSPINIDLTTGSKMFLRNTMKLENYDTVPLEMVLKNDGHSAKLMAKWPLDSIPNVCGGPFSARYLFDSLHFHWGQTNSSGTEHLFNGQRFTLEIHLVHYKSSYGSLKNAANKIDGIAVIGIMFQIGNDDNLTLEPIVSEMYRLKENGKIVQVVPFPLSVFNLNAEDFFITYQGSLTTPPCSQTVTWLLAENFRNVTNEQMKAFRQITLENGDKENVRPVQPLNKRLYYFVLLNAIEILNK